MGVPHSRNRRSAPAAPEGVVRGRPRVEKRKGVGDGRPGRKKQRASTSLALAGPSSPERDDARPAFIDAELVDTDSSSPPAREPLAGQVIEAHIVGYWDDVITIVGSGVAKWASRELQRIFR